MIHEQQIAACTSMQQLVSLSRGVLSRGERDLFNNLIARHIMDWRMGAASAGRVWHAGNQPVVVGVGLFVVAAPFDGAFNDRGKHVVFEPFGPRGGFDWYSMLNRRFQQRFGDAF